MKDLAQHQPNQRPQADFVGERNDEIERKRPLVVHQVDRCGSRRSRYWRDDAVPVKPEKALDLRDDARALIDGLVEQIAHARATRGCVRVGLPRESIQPSAPDRVVHRAHDLLQSVVDRLRRVAKRGFDPLSVLSLPL